MDYLFIKIKEKRRKGQAIGKGFFGYSGKSIYKTSVLRC
jgi:hypothetical protein